MDNSWRPASWQSIKHNILNESPVVFSPSVGYSKDQKDTIMEKTANAVIKELLDAGLICSPEHASGKDKPAWFGDKPADSGTEPKESPKPD